ncbi:hypothetical protein JAAARDRAFT_211776 [Jaapia argillacea MUCL 33604]|uniref:Mandelate racemase/muconate lactonizing enzyme C-terminal domain-containing protein n=1 Tax=Jaapia argillacea MUCL 33604 TaxID=933084 RepID=A0A067PH88_9AGAM|nr:hypothetical protein JAAARDRAFT_211776 [Jaapia argillacea MUCL 33604]
MAPSDPSIITNIEFFRIPPRWLFVLVTTADGYKGWGEATLEGHTEAVEGALLDLAERFVGRNADDIQAIWQEAYRGGFYRGGPVLMSAISGLDIALWDLKGHKLSLPIYSLLGGKVRSKTRVYGWVGGDKPSDVVEGARRRKEQGFGCVKMNATDALDNLASPTALLPTIERVRAIRELGMDVGVDFHGRVHKAMARQLVKALEGEGVLFVEEPLLPTQPSEITDLALTTSIPIALGERLYTRWDWRVYLEGRGVGVGQPDVSHCGGISELHRIASLLEMYDVALAPHCPLGPVALAACMQVGLASQNYVIQEMSWEIHYNKEADLYTYLVDPSVFAVKDGYVEALTSPGLGIQINEELVRETAKKWAGEKVWRTPVWRGVDGTLREW